MEKTRFKPRLLVLSLLLLTAFTGESATRTDLRVLIDVSGSMKTNDPHNLRAPSLRLLIGLMPVQVHAAVWNFAAKVRQQNPLGRATKKWKRRAIRASYKIHSRGQRTNIEAALDQATRDWNDQHPGHNRHLILLTDGMVDISQDDEKNRASRERILQTLLPRIKKTGARIHTIALSDQADFALLKTLSVETGGRHLRIRDAASLHRVFLKLFEASTPVDKLPISGNQFKVDRTVTDMTILLFKNGSSKPTAIRSPGGQTWTHSTHPARVAWKQEKHYDLITVSRPAPGTWHLQTRPDPDNRVVIATNLKLTAARLPRAILENESIRVQARLVQKGKAAKIQPALLALTRFYISRDTGAATGTGRSSQAVLPLNDKGKGADLFTNDGIYSARLYPPPHSHLNQFSIVAKSPTFERILHHEYRTYASAMTIGIDQDKHSGQAVVSARVMPGLFKPGSVKIVVQYPDNTRMTLKRDMTGVYRLKIPKHYQGSKIVTLITGTRTNGASYAYRIAQQLPRTEKGPAQAAAVPKKHVQPAIRKPPATVHKTRHHKKTKKKSRKKRRKSSRIIGRVNWLKVAAAVVLINILAVGGLLLYLWRSGRLPWTTPGGSSTQAGSTPDLEQTTQAADTHTDDPVPLDEGEENKEAA